MHTFKIGDRVVFTNPIDSERIAGVIDGVESQEIDGVEVSLYNVAFSDRAGSALTRGEWLSAAEGD